jgi:hypothetical protein
MKPLAEAVSMSRLTKTIRERSGLRLKAIGRESGWLKSSWLWLKGMLKSSASPPRCLRREI